MIAHCMFEQSGTFKNEFKKLGIEAYDYDIENQFGQTDYQIDLFKEIRGGYNKESSIFDNIKKDDIILAFFPCIRFTDNILLSFRGDNAGFADFSDVKKLEYSKTLSQEQSYFYNLFCEMFIVAIEKDLKLIVENPYNSQSYLTMHFPIKPSIIDVDRSRRGDYYKKPTQFWFVNCKPTNNFIFGREKCNLLNKSVRQSRGIQRSLMHPDYANRFIREFVL